MKARFLLASLIFFSSVMSACGAGDAATDAKGLAEANANAAAADDDGPLVGVVLWEPSLEPDATDYDKTDYWSVIALSPSTGKYGASSEWTSRVNAEREAKENCNARDARVVVACCNGWAALALGEKPAKGDYPYGVGWAPTEQAAGGFALDGAREQSGNARLVYSINSREMKATGVIAYSKSTGQYAYSWGYGRSDAPRALQDCGAPDAEIVAGPASGWLALALGDDTGEYGWGYAGNRADAEETALKECAKRTKNAKVAVSFCTNGVVY